LLICLYLFVLKLRFWFKFTVKIVHVYNCISNVLFKIGASFCENGGRSGKQLFFPDLTVLIASVSNCFVLRYLIAAAGTVLWCAECNRWLHRVSTATYTAVGTIKSLQHAVSTQARSLLLSLTWTRNECSFSGFTHHSSWIFLTEVLLRCRQKLSKRRSSLPNTAPHVHFSLPEHRQQFLAAHSAYYRSNTQQVLGRANLPTFTT
jgi:hypothetical protein